MLAGGGGLGARYACTQARLDGVGEAGRGRAGCTARHCAAFDRRLTQENFPNPFSSGSGAPVAHPGVHARPAPATSGHQARKPGKAGVESGGCVFRRRRTYDGRAPPHAHVRRRSPHTLCLQFVDDTGAVRLGDFGLAIDAGTETPFSRSGTLDYMAPEAMPLFLEGEQSGNRHLWHAERVVHQRMPIFALQTSHITGLGQPHHRPGRRARRVPGRPEAPGRAPIRRKGNMND